MPQAAIVLDLWSMGRHLFTLRICVGIVVGERRVASIDAEMALSIMICRKMEVCSSFLVLRRFLREVGRLALELVP